MFANNWKIACICYIHCLWFVSVVNKSVDATIQECHSWLLHSHNMSAVLAVFHPSFLLRLCLTRVPHTLTTQMSSYSVLNVSANESPPKSDALRKEAVTWLPCVTRSWYQIFTFAAIIFTLCTPPWRHLVFAVTLPPQGYLCHSSNKIHNTNSRIVSAAERQK